MKLSTLICLLAAAAVLVIGIVAIQSGWLSGSGDDTKGEPLLDVRRADIVSLAVTRSDGQPLRLVRIRDQWRITSPIWGPADAEAAERAVFAVSEMRSARRYPVNDPARPDDDQTGLKTPRMVIGVSDIRNGRHEIRIGQHPPLIRETYVQLASSSDILLAGPDPTRTLTRPVSDYRDNQLLEFDPNQLTRIIVAGQSNYELIRHSEGWTLKRDGVRGVEADIDAVESLAERLSKLRITDVTSLHAGDLEAFGLDPAGLTFLLVLQRQVGQPSFDRPDDPTGPDAIEVKFGSAEGRIFVMLEGDRRLLNIAPTDFDSLIVPPTALRDRHVVPASAEEIAAITIRTAGKALTLDRVTTPAHGKLTIEGAARTIEQLQAHSYVTHYSTLAGYGLATSASTVMVATHTGTTYTFLVGDRDESREGIYVKCVGDPVVMVCRSRALAKLIEHVAAIRPMFGPAGGK